MDTRLSVNDAAIGVLDPEADVEQVAVALQRLRLGDTPRIGRAVRRARREAGRRCPDRVAVGGAVERAMRIAARAADFPGQVARVQPPVLRLAAWIGPSAGSLIDLVEPHHGAEARH